MAAVADKSGEAALVAAAANDKKNSLEVETPKSESKEFNVQNLVDMFTKLNPLAKEFFPSSYQQNQTKSEAKFIQVPVGNKSVGNENVSNRRVFFVLQLNCIFCLILCSELWVFAHFYLLFFGNVHLFLSGFWG